MSTMGKWTLAALAVWLLAGCGGGEPHQVGIVEMAEIDVAPKIPGRVDSLLVREGDWVEAGQLLAVIRSDEIEARVEQARGLLAAAEARLRMAETGARPEEIRAVASQLESAKAQFELAEKTWGRVQAVFADSVISTQERDEVEFKYRAAREQLEAGRAKYEMVRKGARDEEIDAARALAHQARNALAEAEAYRAETRMKAPRAGRVHSLALDAGELAAAGVPVATLVDTTDAWVVLQLREDMLRGAKPGRIVTGELPGLDGRSASFKVTRVAPQADYATWRSTSRKGDLDLRSFEVQLRPDSPLDGLRAGIMRWSAPDPNGILRAQRKTERRRTVSKKQNPQSAIKVIGVDLAKSVLSVHAVDDQGKVVMRKKLSPAKFLAWIAGVPPCLVGLEACGGAHHMGREVAQHGHDVRLMAPQFVKPYVKSHKSDALDAEAICEAVQRPTMRFVAVKTRDQQNMQALHRVRDLAVTRRTALGNQIRGLLAEHGVAVAQRIYNLRRALAQLVEDTSLDREFLWLLRELRGELVRLDEQVAIYDERLKAFLAQDETAQRLATIPGIGVLGATVLPAAIGDAAIFRNGRQCSAWLGLVPHQHSTGGRTRLLGITKRGNSYARRLLIHGARAVLGAAERFHKTDALSRWVVAISQRRGKNRAVVALANKLARMAWALLASGGRYQPKTT